MQYLSIKVALFINYALFAILLNSVGTVILQVQLTYNVTESDAAILEAFKDLSIAAASFIATSLCMRAGFRNSIMLALAAVAFAGIAMPFVPQFWMNKLMFAVTGISFALVKVATYSVIGIITKGKKEHASLMSFIESFFMAGIFFSYFLFSWFVDDANPGSTQWLKVYWALAAGCGISLVTMMLARLDESEVTNETSGKPLSKEFSDMFKLAIKPLIIVFVMSAFLYTVIEQSIMTWLPTFNNTVLNMSASLSIQMASILALSFAIGRFIAGFVLRKIDWFPMVVGCLLLAAILVLAALPLASGIGETEINSWAKAPIAAYVFPLMGICLAPIYPAIVSVILTELPKQKHAAMSALIIIFGALGGTTGSILTGNLFERLGGTNAFYSSLVPITLMIIALFIFKKMAGNLRNVDTAS